MSYFTRFLQNLDLQGLVGLLLQVFAVLVCLTVHETCHGFAALALGDPTAKSQNRLSLNPLRHIDPVGTLMMIVAGFGWAKPVPVDMRYFKHPKSGMALTALAGPVSNFVLAYGALLTYALTWGITTGGGLHNPSSPADALMEFLWMLASLSVGLGIFNLIPFPPLDGSKVVEGILPDRIYYNILRYERIGMFILMAVLWFGILDAPLFAARSLVMDLLLSGSVWVADLFM